MWLMRLPLLLFAADVAESDLESRRSSLRERIEK
jgi:hypothetical protein